MEQLSQKIEEQNKTIDKIISQEKSNQEKLVKQIDEEVSNLSKYISELNKLNPPKFKNPLALGLTSKIDEFNNIISQNEAKIKENKEKIPEIERKKKENDDFFNKFIGEKKVWLDRLDEKKFQNVAYEGSFKYFYEAKTIKLLMEGILLLKVQDEVEKEMSFKGQALGWDIMNNENYEKKRKDEEYQLNLQLLAISNKDEALKKEKEFKERYEREEIDLKQRQEEYGNLWKKIYGELWVPSVPYSGDESLTQPKEITKRVIMDVTFKMFKKHVFDVWRFKNILNNTDQYIIMDKIRKLLVDNKDSSDHQKQEEIAFDKIFNIIEGIRREEEIIYCDLKPAKTKLEQIKISSEEKANVNTSVERISNIIEKIENIQKNLEFNPSMLIKREVEEIFAMIKNLQDENEKKLFRDNFVENSRFYDVFLPLTNILMIESYMSIGFKKTKNYKNNIQQIITENEKLEKENNEIKGKLKTLKEVYGKVNEEELEQEDFADYNEAKKSLIELTQSIMSHEENISKQQNELFGQIKSNLVQLNEK